MSNTSNNSHQPRPGQIPGGAGWWDLGDDDRTGGPCAATAGGVAGGDGRASSSMAAESRGAGAGCVNVGLRTAGAE